MSTAKCPTCGGTGYGDECGPCGGTGHVPTTDDRQRADRRMDAAFTAYQTVIDCGGTARTAVETAMWTWQDAVLAPHGTLCFELGDTYSGGGGENHLWDDGYSGGVKGHNTKKRGRFLVVHDEWPGWNFVLTMKAADLIGFEMYGDGSQADSQAARDHRGKALEGVFVPVEPVRMTARMVRTVPFRALETAVRQHLSGEDGVFRSGVVAARYKTLRAARGGAGVKRGTSWTQRRLAELCADYVAVSAAAADGKVYDELAKRWHLSAKTLRNLISGARGDLITKSPPGRAGGQLLDKAEQLLSEGEIDGEH